MPEGKTLTLPSKARIKTAYTEYHEVEPVVKNITYQPKWFSEYPNVTDKLEASISPSSAKPIADARVSDLVSIGQRMAIKGSPDMAELGNAIHAVIAAKCINADFSNDDLEALLQ